MSSFPTSFPTTFPTYTQLVEKGEWSSGICDCFSDCRLCIISCVPVVNVLSLGQTYTAAHGKTGLIEDPICGVAFPLIGLFLFTPILCIQVYLLRNRFRQPPYSLPGDDVQDCLCAFCCGWCAMQQCARHLTAHPEHLKGDAYLFAQAPGSTNSMSAEGKAV